MRVMMRGSAMDLTRPLPPLTSRQRSLFLAAWALSALSRFAARAKTLWDWDETLFCLGMRSYDVSQHHPHPPGFPVYIGIGRLFRFFIHDDFRALQSVNLTAGMLLFPAMFLLARELRIRFATAVVSGLLCAFLPAVWFFGGTAFSDVPSLTLVVFAAAMLLRGCRDPRAYVIGAALLGLAAGIRPQNLLIGAFPALIATWYRWRVSWRQMALGISTGAIIVAVAFGAAIAATGGYARYMDAVHGHAEYISQVDSFHNPARPPLWRLFDRFFIKQYDAPTVSILVSLFVLISAFESVRRRDQRTGYLALTFVPFAIVAWLMLDRFSISRFAIGYCPLFAILASDGMDRVCRGRDRWLTAAATIVIGWFAIFLVPALSEVRNEASPPVRGIEAVRQNVHEGDDLFVAFAMTPFVEYFLPGQRFHRVIDERALPLTLTGRPSFLLVELDRTAGRGMIFRRKRNQLWRVARRHYFDVALTPSPEGPEFVSGWYAAERNDADEWRWMGARSVTKLPPLNVDSVVRLAFDLPDEVMGRHPEVTIALNGKVIDRIHPAESHLSRDYEVKPAPGGQPNVLELSTSQVVNPQREHLGDDGRDLGLLIRSLSWGPS